MVESRTVSPEALLEIRANDGEIHDLIMWLESFDGRPGLNELGERLESLDVDVESLRNTIQSNPNDYCRNTLLRTDYYEIVAIIWRPGQDTPIHDHLGSDCAFLIFSAIFFPFSNGTILSLSPNIQSVGQLIFAAASKPFL